ncbi:hypothetical protein PV721_33440 [Streptomyces sp. MB09-01]|uniref:hypothetical protein n=1 Tax=Streptomyces sp. MB09-01 TaxID=3028666 RepID=UPI0029A99D1F|nr:hypothetical protein [Streptomyces sp. MB09-01]MDX3539143.1 hypothetical protein [Streptomyces sp. MB09-01]
MIHGPHRTKGAPALGALPGQDGPFGRRPEPDADDHPSELRTQTLLCPFCAAEPAADRPRTIAATGDRLTVTWHRLACPHYAADRILAGEEE